MRRIFAAESRTTGASPSPADIYETLKQVEPGRAKIEAPVPHAPLPTSADGAGGGAVGGVLGRECTPRYRAYLLFRLFHLDQPSWNNFTSQLHSLRRTPPTAPLGGEVNQLRRFVRKGWILTNILDRIAHSRLGKTF